MAPPATEMVTWLVTATMGSATIWLRSRRKIWSPYYCHLPVHDESTQRCHATPIASSIIARLGTQSIRTPVGDPERRSSQGSAIFHFPYVPFINPTTRASHLIPGHVWRGDDPQESAAPWRTAGPIRRRSFAASGAPISREWLEKAGIGNKHRLGIGKQRESRHWLMTYNWPCDVLARELWLRVKITT